MILKTEGFAFGESNYYLQMTNGREPFTLMHSHEFYEIMCVISGGCHQIINSKHIYMKHHSLILLRPGDEHKIVRQVPGTNMLSVSVKEKCIETFLQAYGTVVTDLIVKPEMPPGIETDTQAASYISDAYNSLATSKPEEREMYCNILLSKVLQSLATQNQSILNNEPETNSQPKNLLFDALNQMNNPENIAGGIVALQRF